MIVPSLPMRGEIDSAQEKLHAVRFGLRHTLPDRLDSPLDPDSGRCFACSERLPAGGMISMDYNSKGNENEGETGK